MNDELKEILSNDNIHIIECDKNWCNAYGYEKSQLKEDLLDYITNLQKENESLKEELEISKNLNICVGCENNPDYKSRCEKALKELKEIRQSTFTKYNSNEWGNCLSYNDDIEPLENILNGGDEE